MGYGAMPGIGRGIVPPPNMRGGPPLSCNFFSVVIDIAVSCQVEV